MKEKIKDCFDRLQELTIISSLPNMEKLVQTLYDLRDVYQGLDEDEEGEENGGTEDHPEEWVGN